MVWFQTLIRSSHDEDPSEYHCGGALRALGSDHGLLQLERQQCHVGCAIDFDAFLDDHDLIDWGRLNSGWLNERRRSKRAGDEIGHSLRHRISE